MELAVEQKLLPVQPLRKGEGANENAFLGNIGWTVLGVGRVDVGSGFLRTFPILQQSHHILCDIYTDGTTEGMIVESEFTFVIYL